MSSGQQTPNGYTNQEWYPKMADAFSQNIGNFVQPEDFGMNPNLYPRSYENDSNIIQQNVPTSFEFSQFQDEFQHHPGRNQNENSNTMPHEKNLDPQGMIITVEGGRRGQEGSEREGQQNEIDFENAFFS